jgi:ABC-type histidine transport system ATPase subunit
MQNDLAVALLAKNGLQNARQAYAMFFEAVQQNSCIAILNNLHISAAAMHWWEAVETQSATCHV